ncbi:MAG: hypothetical protein J6A01_07720 [Proteobacteria bacterium]|nr:hypothetical protein [Pseudomonadota bacterium]
MRRLHTLLVLGKRSNNLALAIRKAIETIAAWNQSAEDIVAHTPIKQIFAGYGPKFIKIFEELMQTGEIALIGQLQPEFDPFFCYLCEIPGIGETMARRMFFDRSIQSMDDLRIAYTNNVLQRIPAFGDARLKAIEDILWQSQKHHHWEKPLDNESPAEEHSQTAETVHDSMNSREFKTPEFISSQLDLFGSVFPEAKESSQDRTLPLFDVETPLESDISAESFKTEEQNQPAEQDEFTQDINSRTSVWDLPETQDEQQASTDLDAYPQEFIESNSLLFRDIKPQATPVEPDPLQHEEDTILSEDDENLAKALVQAMEVKPPRDEQLERELGAVIARDLAEHGIQRELPALNPTPTIDNEDEGEILKGDCLKACFIRAEIVYAETIHAKTIHCTQIVLEPQHSYCSSGDAISLDEIQTHQIEVNEILADSLFVREIHAHCITADIIVYAPYDHK